MQIQDYLYNIFASQIFCISKKVRMYKHCILTFIFIFVFYASTTIASPCGTSSQYLS